MIACICDNLMKLPQTMALLLAILAARGRMPSALVFLLLLTLLLLGASPIAFAVHGASPQERHTGRPALALQTTPALVSAAGGVLPLGGISVTLPVNVSNVANLGAVTVELGYDNSLVAPQDCKINRPAFDGGLCNIRFDSNGDGKPDTVKFNAFSLKSAGVNAPAEPGLPVVEIAWIVSGTATVGAVAPLTVTVTNFAAVGGEASLPVTAQHGQILIAAAPPTATPTPTPMHSPTATATTTPTSTNTPAASATATSTPDATTTPTPAPTATMTPAPSATSTSPDGEDSPHAIYLPAVASP